MTKNYIHLHPEKEREKLTKLSEVRGVAPLDEAGAILGSTRRRQKLTKLSERRGVTLLDETGATLDRQGEDLLP